MMIVDEIKYAWKQNWATKGMLFVFPIAFGMNLYEVNYAAACWVFVGFLWFINSMQGQMLADSWEDVSNGWKSLFEKVKERVEAEMEEIKNDK